ncbi:MAG: cyclic nucleotide-binding domain-containing protein [Actinomycetota bacterium]
MKTQTLDKYLATHEFFQGFDQPTLEFIAGCAQTAHFEPGEYLAREGQPADRFYVIRLGTVALEVFAPERGALILDTLDEHDVLGVSWIFPPYRWQFDARAVDLVRAIALDGACLRAKCDEDPHLGYEFMKRFAGIMARRMQSARLRLLDLYGNE